MNMSIETQLKSIQDAEAKVSAAKSALKLAEDDLKAARLAAVESVDLNDFAACLALHEALNDDRSKAALTRRVGRHRFPIDTQGKIYAIKENYKPMSAYVVTDISYNLYEGGVSCWVKFAPVTKSWERNEATKWSLPALRIADMPIERSKSDFEWSAKDRAWVLRSETEVAK